MKVGLRFRSGDARALEDLAARVRGGDLHNHHAETFAAAARAATAGEPLIVHCDKPVEAILMAEGYVRFGINRPAVEELSGT